MTLSQTHRRVIVHIGAQKTGSTSLHRFLSRNRAALATRLDLRVPEKGSLTREVGRSCTLYSMRPDRHEGTLITLIKALKEDLSGNETVCIVSHENIAGAMMGRGSVRDLFPRIADIVRLFDEHLAPIVPEYVLYTREMAGWKRSVHNQAVKSDGYTGTLETFLKETADSRGWQDVAKTLEACIGTDRVRVFALEDETTPERPGRQLLKLAGLSDEDIDVLEPLASRSNQSLNPGALEFMRQLNMLAVAQPARKQVAELIKNNQSLFAAGPMPQREA
ncbi:hypothetical protein [Shimia marina]|uniref:Uncharacterized protein n=1 Tax=Shimia marina TaxID=321267 RepID=A0A0N7LSQ8_9RHOB|nr:hypothetical protein [Shimia marina]CUH54300.1 hypothetical protein SHM7688_03770 [Shimia marina]SFD99895.1 hypothetical protein SAMN04488037_104179 [Shimia marina]